MVYQPQQKNVTPLPHLFYEAVVYLKPDMLQLHYTNIFVIKTFTKEYLYHNGHSHKIFDAAFLNFYFQNRRFRNLAADILFSNSYLSDTYE